MRGLAVFISDIRNCEYNEWPKFRVRGQIHNIRIGSSVANSVVVIIGYVDEVSPRHKESEKLCYYYSHIRLL